MSQTESCNRHSACQKKGSIYASWLPAIFIAILPKCPFCIMAYSGAMSMCSGKMLFPNADAYSGYIIIGLSLLILFSILLNHKGTKTWIASFIVLIGISLLTMSQYLTMSEPLYYLASFVLFFGIWYNGSFTFFYKKYFKSKIKTNTSILN